MSVLIKCAKCGVLASYNYDRSHTQVSQVVNEHKDILGKNHRVRVKRT